jgi:hypothetical protein
MGRIKPRLVLESMDIANRFADGEDTCNNKRMQSPEDDRGNKYGSQRRRSHNYDNYGSHSQVAVGWKDNNYQGDDHGNLGYRSYGREYSGNNKRFQSKGLWQQQKIPVQGTQGIQSITRRYAKRTMPYTLCVR